MQHAEHAEHAELVDINEAARMTGLNPQTIYRLVRQGRVRSFKVLSRSVRFDRTDLQALLSEKPSHPAAPETGIKPKAEQPRLD